MILAALCVASSCFFGARSLLHETWSELPAGRAFGDGARFGAWIERFTGYGHASIVWDDDLGPSLELEPRASTVASETHGALVTSAMPFENFDATVALVTREQLRAPGANPWETAWVLWDYRDPKHFTYFSLRTNGWELGQRVPGTASGQRFLRSGEYPRASVGSVHAVRVISLHDRIYVYVDGLPVVRYDGLSSTGGAFGLYCEDARAHFGVVHIARAS